MLSSSALPVVDASRSHLNNMSLPIGSQATAIDPGSEFPAEGSVDTRHPVTYFTVLLSEPALVVLDVQEANTASRCAVFLSCTCPRPDTNNAAWRLVSPEPIKQIVLHPADPAYRVGTLFIAVQYLEPSGRARFQIRAHVQPEFFAMWLRTGEVKPGAAVRAAGDVPLSLKQGRLFANAPSVGAVAATSRAAAPTLHATLCASAAPPWHTVARAAFTSLYVGDWRGDQRDGFGFQYYAAPEEAVSHLAAGAAEVLDFENSSSNAADSGSRGSSTPHREASSSPEVGAAGGNGTRAVPGAAVDMAQPLLLLRAFSERHNLPWSAWSIPDTLTPEELARLGFGFYFHSTTRTRSVRSSPRLSNATAGGSITAAVDSHRAKATASPPPLSQPPRLPSSTLSVSVHGGATGAAELLPPTPPTPPVAPCPTAADGIAALGGAIDAFMAAEIASSEVDGWLVLPVQPGVEVYAGEWVANQKEGSGAYQWADRSYVGDWVAGRREGYGLLRRQDGGWYRGQWERYVPHGRGEARLVPGGLLHKGEWREGRRHGPGGLTYPNGMTVHGVWVDGELQPSVRVVYQDGSVYHGAWDPEGACRQGHGTLTDTRGCRHTHVWQHDTRVGPGQEAYPNGVALEGLWRADELVSGTYVFPNGDRHVGAMDTALNIREGAGTTVSSDGITAYTGAWQRDKRSGRGVQTVRKTLKAATGGGGGPGLHEAAGVEGEELYEGEWRDDVRSGQGRLTDGDDVYDGDFAEGCRDGVGTQRNIRTGSFYQGHWKKNHRCGAGVYYSATEGVTYDGIFMHNRLTGVGTATKSDTAEQYSGTWLDGLQQGHGTLRLANGDLLRGVWHRGAPETAATVEYVEADLPSDRPRRIGAAMPESRYVGGWQDGVRQGVGTQVFRDGSVYEGTWHANKQHGRGRRTNASGESLECDWLSGHIVEGCIGEARFADGSVYHGQVNTAGVPHGAGVLTYPDGTVFDGTYVDGIYQL